MSKISQIHQQHATIKVVTLNPNDGQKMLVVRSAPTKLVVI